MARELYNGLGTAPASDLCRRPIVGEGVVDVDGVEAEPREHRAGGSGACTAIAVHEQRLVDRQVAHVDPDSGVRNMERVCDVAGFELRGSANVEHVRTPGDARSSNTTDTNRRNCARTKTSASDAGRTGGKNPQACAFVRYGLSA